MLLCIVNSSPMSKVMNYTFCNYIDILLFLYVCKCFNEILNMQYSFYAIFNDEEKREWYASENVYLMEAIQLFFFSENLEIWHFRNSSGSAFFLRVSKKH